MAGAIYTACTTVETALVATSQKCLIRLISTTNSAVKVKEWGVFFDGILSTSPPVVVMLCAVDTSFGNYTTHTPVKRAGPAIVARSVCQTMNTSSDPTIFGIYAHREVHPQSGYQEKFAYGDEIIIAGSATVAGGAVGLIVNSPTTLNVIGEIVFEE